jgi:adenosine deaminase CECR1
MLWGFAEDGLQYAEIRVGFNTGFSITSDDGARKLNQRDIICLFREVLKKELPRLHREGHEFEGVKIIWACLRNSHRETINRSMDECIELKQEFPDLICGMLTLHFPYQSSKLTST